MGRRKTALTRISLGPIWLLISVFIVLPLIVLLAAISPIWNVVVRRVNAGRINRFNRKAVRLWHWNESNTKWFVFHGPSSNFEALP